MWQFVPMEIDLEIVRNNSFCSVESAHKFRADDLDPVFISQLAFLWFQSFSQGGARHKIRLRCQGRGKDHWQHNFPELIPTGSLSFKM
jgi:hypothetical protein